MRALGGIALAAVVGCGAAASQGVTRGGVTYEGVQTRLLDGDLVAFDVAASGAADGAIVTAYAECAAAQYTLIRGYGFARHVRTNVARSGSRWLADAIYIISPAIPAGVTKIDAEVAVAECGRRGIPTA